MSIMRWDKKNTTLLIAVRGTEILHSMFTRDALPTGMNHIDLAMNELKTMLLDMVSRNEIEDFSVNSTGCVMHAAVARKYDADISYIHDGDKVDVKIESLHPDQSATDNIISKDDQFDRAMAGV